MSIWLWGVLLFVTFLTLFVGWVVIQSAKNDREAFLDVIFNIAYHMTRGLDGLKAFHLHEVVIKAENAGCSMEDIKIAVSRGRTEGELDDTHGIDYLEYWK